MEALERQNNAKEALGMGSMPGSEQGDDEGTGERGGVSGSGSGSDAKTADKRLEALKSSMAKKVGRGTCVVYR